MFQRRSVGTPGGRFMYVQQVNKRYIKRYVVYQELRALLRSYPQAVATQTAWLDACCSRQALVDATPFLYTFS